MTTSTRKNFLLCLALLGVSAVTVSAQSDTVPAGYFTVTIPPGTVQSPSLSLLSFPLLQTADSTIGGVTSGPSGQMVGQVTAITSNTITNSNAGWSGGQLSIVATPYLVQFTSGTASGRTFLISTTVANTSTTLTLDSSETTDLTTLGIVAGTDTYQIIPADTISSIFGTPATTGIIGAAGASLANQADQVQIYSTSSSVWLSYYYNTTLTGSPAAPVGWVRTGIFPTSGANVVIRPDSGVLYTRRGAALSLMLMGQAPSVARQTSINSGGLTLLSNNWPVDIGLGKTAVENGVTLKSSNFENISGWVTGASSVADNVLVYSSGVWLTYYNNGTDWIRTGVFPTNGDSIIIPAGSLVLLSKKTATSQPSILSETLPYSL
jgi:hypothetical protein